MMEKFSYECRMTRIYESVDDGSLLLVIPKELTEDLIQAKKGCTVLSKSILEKIKKSQRRSNMPVISISMNLI